MLLSIESFFFTLYLDQSKDKSLLVNANQPYAISCALCVCLAEKSTLLLEDTKIDFQIKCNLNLNAPNP